MRSLTLTDGRRLTFEELGARQGAPLFFFHGTPSSSRVARLLHRSARAGNIRVIAANRPGIGGSSFQRGRSIADWPADVAALADHLGIERFSVCGHSGGSPYALACACLLPARVASAVIVHGAIPGELAIDAALSADARRQLRQFDRPRALRAMGAAAAWLAMLAVPQRFVDFAIRRSTGSDSVFLRTPAVAAGFVSDLKAALAGAGRGAVHDHWLVGRPAGLDLASVSCPVSLWYGEDDHTTHPDFGVVLNRAIPGSELHRIPNAGHMWVFSGFEQVAAWISKASPTVHKAE